MIHMNNKQLEVYYEKYYSLVYRVAFTQMKSHADAEDASQEVFLRLMKYKPVFERSEHEKAWMIRTVINLCKDMIKSKWHNTVVGIDQIPENEKEYFTIPYLQEDETVWALLELPEKYKNCLYFFYYEDYSVKEIASLLELPENTVKTNLRRGREELKKKLTADGQRQT